MIFSVHVTTEPGRFSGSEGSCTRNRSLDEIGRKDPEGQLVKSPDLVSIRLHNGNIGTAAVLKQEGKPDRTIRYHLGPAELHMVYEVELVSILMGLHLLKTEHKGKVKCALSVDNQAALKVFSSDMTKLGQHITVKLLQAVKQLKAHKNNSHFKLTFRWSAGHVGIKGNEEANGEVKRAAEGESLDPRDLPPYLHKPLGHSISALR